MYRIRRSRIFFQSADNSNEEEEKEFEKEGEEIKEKEIIPQINNKKIIYNIICFRIIFGGIPDYKHFRLSIAYFLPIRGNTFIFGF